MMSSDRIYIPAMALASLSLTVGLILLVLPWTVWTSAPSGLEKVSGWLIVAGVVNGAVIGIFSLSSSFSGKSRRAE